MNNKAAKKEDISIYLTQAQNNVAFTGFMTAVVVFFNGLLLTNFESYASAIKIPIAFLIISTFGFLYSTLIFANATGEILNNNIKKFRWHEGIGNIISEYFGVYLLIFSIPLIVNMVTSDPFLQIVTATSTFAGLLIYQFSHFSIMERHFGKSHNLVSLLIIGLGIGLVLTQIYQFYFTQLAAVFILFMISIAYRAIRETLS